MKTFPRIIFLTIFCGLLSVGHALMRIGPELVPVDRLIKSADAYLAKHPQEAEAYYTLARIHYLAFAMKQNRIPAYLPNGDGNVQVPPDWQRDGDVQDNGEEGQPAQPPTTAVLLDHAARALTNFNEAVKRDPKRGLYALGLASLLDQFRTWNEATKPTGVPPELQGVTVAKVREAYTKALAIGLVTDAKPEALPETVHESIAEESAAALIRLAKEDPASMTAEDQRQLKSAEKVSAAFSRSKRPLISPMVFALQPATHLDEMLDPARIVDFDLRGYGPRDRWPWVKPELGFLVWDPLESGRIESARQMFGSFTFRIFRRTGYDAMAALDDNEDGVLSGSELAGLSVWFDRDSDGVSTKSEVVPLRDLAVESIAVKATGMDGIHPTNPRGLTLRGGQTLPTWDWMVAPVPKP